jgi:hypothetical protein
MPLMCVWLTSSPGEGYGVAGAGMLGAVNFARSNAQDLESEFLQKGYLEGIRYQISVEKGDVSPVVARIVEEEGIDLLIAGTRGRSGLGRLLLGQERAFPDGFLTAGRACPSVRGFVGAGT